MKKILLATTALTLTAGMAAAEVKVTGDANMGVKYTEGASQEITLHHEIDFGISGSTTTDNGLTFGASLDIDTDNSSNNFGPAGGANDGADGEVFVSGGFGKLMLGKIDAASDSVGFGALEVGFDGLGLDDVAEGAYAAGSHDVLYTTSMGAISFAASMSSSDSDDTISAGAKFSGAVTASVGYVNTGDVRVTSIGVAGSAAGIDYKLAAVSNSDDAVGNSYGIGVSYGLGNGAAMQFGFANADNDDDSSMGLGFTYGLGGGATLAGGWASIDGTNKADLGVSFKF